LPLAAEMTPLSLLRALPGRRYPRTRNCLLYKELESALEANFMRSRFWPAVC
jgi:hypothetical protein